MKKVVSIWSQLQFLVVYKDFRTTQPLILLGLQKLTDYFSAHLLTVLTTRAIFHFRNRKYNNHTCNNTRCSL